MAWTSLAERLVFFRKIFEEFRSGLFSQVLPFEISAWVRRVRCRSLARSLPPLKLKNQRRKHRVYLGPELEKKHVHH